MDKINKAICEQCAPLYEQWRAGAKLSAAEAKAYWLAKFEGKTIYEISYLLHYSDRTINRLIKSAAKKIHKILN